MALGWDQALAQASINLGIPFVAAIPCATQYKRWPVESQKYYHELLDQAMGEEIIGEKYTPTCMQERNVWMVDNSDIVLALWNGSHGGTYYCIQYANSIDRTVINVWKSWIKYNQP
jgi:uncharacterized phage-like protein YoqJ